MAERRNKDWLKREQEAAGRFEKVGLSKTEARRLARIMAEACRKWVEKIV